MRSVIFANGVLNHSGNALKLLNPRDLIIAADGGAGHCLAMGIKPGVAIGDFDSLSPDHLNRLKETGTEIIRHPVRKDFTDLELALKLAVDRGADEILILGALGRRWDMTIANIFMLAAPILVQTQVRIVDDFQEIILLCEMKPHSIHGRAGDTLSLVPLSEDVQGITLGGLEYPLQDDILKFGATRGISNVLVNDTATIYFKQGQLLCILTRTNRKEITSRW
ncbi:MAG: thiamine diphosphokinase [Deltaproteobacteria bacterium]|nr:thiamine diphosphokinase [Deltaproteobacteria bacterium]